jgi:hypothetical protein
MKETTMERTEYSQDTPRTDAPYPMRRRDLPYKVPALAGFLCGIMPGLGHVYLGYFQLGVTVALVFAGCITALSIGVQKGLEPMFGFAIAFTYLYGIVDAIRRAFIYNRYLEGLGNDIPPPEMVTPGWGGSRAGGVVLILLGVLLALETMFDIELEWLGDVWPLALVGLGIWLFVKARRK